MKKITSLLILLIAITLLTGCQKKYEQCLNACEESFTSITPTGINEDGKVQTAKQKMPGYNECAQSCIQKYK